MKRFLRLAFYLYIFIGFSSLRAGSYDDFFRAVDLDDARTVSALLAQGFEPNAVSENGQTALVLALRANSMRVADALMRHPGLNPDAANRAGETPLMMAALRGNFDAMRQLLALGAAPERKGWTPLHYAASGPEPKAVAFLLDRGVRIDAPSPNRSTALMMASRYGAWASADLLLDRGADPRLRNDAGLTAADFARAAGRADLVRRLEQAVR
jgi:ankyrin repeat protein